MRFDTCEKWYAIFMILIWIQFGRVRCLCTSRFCYCLLFVFNPLYALCLASLHLISHIANIAVTMWWPVQLHYSISSQHLHFCATHWTCILCHLQQMLLPLNATVLGQSCCFCSYIVVRYKNMDKSGSGVSISGPCSPVILLSGPFTPFCCDAGIHWGWNIGLSCSFFSHEMRLGAAKNLTFQLDANWLTLHWCVCL